jgi:hypothetical protein
MSENIRDQIVEALGKFGGRVASMPEADKPKPPVAASYKSAKEPDTENRLYVELTGSRTLMDMTACALAQTAPSAGVLFHPVWFEEDSDIGKTDAVKQGKALTKRVPNRTSKSGVTLRLSLEPGSVARVEAASKLVNAVMAHRYPQLRAAPAA